MGLYRKAHPGELLMIQSKGTALIHSTGLILGKANKSAKRGRPIVSTGDPAKDKRNAQQRDLMRKRRAKSAK